MIVESLSEITPPVALESAWTEGEHVLCIVYRQPYYYPWTLGLRRVVESDWTIAGVADEVLTCELGEPLGSLLDTLQADDAGVMWWSGNPPAWKARR